MIISTGSFIVALFAIYLSFLTYIRQKTFENENHIYKFKFEKEYEILKQIGNLYVFLESKIDEFYDNVAITNSDTKVLDKIRDELYDRTDNFFIEIYANSALLPEVVILSILNFTNKLQEIDIIPFDTIGSYGSAFTMLDELELFVDQIEKAIRNDLHIDVLNESLSSRLKFGDRKKRK